MDSTIITDRMMKMIRIIRTDLAVVSTSLGLGWILFLVFLPVIFFSLI